MYIFTKHGETILSFRPFLSAFLFNFLPNFYMLLTTLSRLCSLLSSFSIQGQQQRARRSLFQQNYTTKKRQTFVPWITNGSKQRGESLLPGTRQRQSFIIARITRNREKKIRKKVSFRNIHLRLILPKQRGNRRARMRAALFSGLIVDRRSVTQTMFAVQRSFFDGL